MGEFSCVKVNRFEADVNKPNLKNQNFSLISSTALKSEFVVEADDVFIIVYIQIIGKIASIIMY